MWRVRVFVVLIVLVVVGSMVVTAATPTFADPAFGAQWQMGEAITPNFWGPNVTGAVMEPYGDAAGQTRLVQYFDKGRMEKAANGGVTNGLLATELISGKVQLSDTKFDPQQSAAVPVAGDPDNPGPTYAQIQANAAQLMVATTTMPNTPVTRSLSGTGMLGTAMTGMSDPQAAIASFDDTTKHNVPKAFADYRGKAGIATIGLAIAEPFWANVKVGGAPKDVLVQAFERRVLTYTPANADAFKVEMGNIGQHYAKWRGSLAKATGTTTPPASVTAPVVATTAMTAPATGVASLTPAATTTTGTATVAANTTPAATPRGGGSVVTTGRMPGAICKAGGGGGTYVVCTKT